MSRAKVRVPKEATRKHLARAEREARQQRIMLLALGAALVLAIALVGYGFLDERVLKPQQPVATVNGVNISTGDFQKRVKYELFRLNSQLADLESQKQTFGSEPTLSFFVQQIDQQIGSLQSLLSSPTMLGQRVLDGMIEDELVRQEAARRKIAASLDQVKTDIEHSFNFYRVPPTATPTPTASPTPLASPTPQPTATVSITPTATPEPTETPAPTPTPVTEQAFNTAFGNYMNQIAVTGMTRDDINKLVESSLLRRRLQEEFNKDVPTTAEQVQFRYISFELPEQAQAAETKLKSGASFDELFNDAQAGAVVSATASSEPWAPIDELASNYPPDIVNLVLSLGISQTSQIITTTSAPGAMIFQQIGRGVQPLSSYQLSNKQEKAFQDWLDKQRTGPGVNLYNNRYLTRLPTLQQAPKR